MGVRPAGLGREIGERCDTMKTCAILRNPRFAITRPIVHPNGGEKLATLSSSLCQKRRGCGV